MKSAALRVLCGATLVVAVLGALPFVGAAQAPMKSETDEPKVGPMEAMQVAARESQGKAFSAHLRRVDGKWIYEVLVTKGAKLKRLLVSSNNGKVVLSQDTTPQDVAENLFEELNVASGKPAKLHEAEEDGDEGGG